MNLENIAEDEVQPVDAGPPHRVSVKFIMPLSVHYSVKHDAPELEALWKRDYQEALDGFSDDVLSDAAKRIIRKRNYANFPMVADCIEACNEAMEGRLAKGPEAYSHLSRTYPEWSRERIRLANRLINSDAGKKAVKDGWIIRLWDFCRDNKRLPYADEVPQLIAASRSVWATFKAASENGKPLAPIVQQTAATLQRRRDELKEIVEGRAATIAEARRR